jgi:16S rRNA (cytosine1402-N4)-methyltransferase
MGAAGSGHQPVLTDRVLALLGPALDRPGAVVLDGTLGRAGTPWPCSASIPAFP